MKRARVDAALRGLLGSLHGVTRVLPVVVSRFALRCVAALGFTLTWPWSEVRRRSQTANLPLSPWRWGWELGGNLAALLGAPAPLVSSGWPAAASPALILAAHSGPWEAAAAELARRGVRPLVIAAPWPGLPRTEATVQALRRKLGVEAVPRGRKSLVRATRHLRGGGWVVVLVDSLHPRKNGRRALPFVDGPIGAPDGLVAWAARQGAAVLVATAREHEFILHPILDCGAGRRLDERTIHSLSDRVVGLLRTRALARPWEWAWVRALAAVTVMTLQACAPSTPLPPLPLDPSHWRADISDLTWQQDVDGAALEFQATAARVRQVDSSWAGAFEDIRLLWVTHQGREVEVRGATALGTVPTGPLTISEAIYSIDGVTGDTPRLRWLGGKILECGGCPLETILDFVESPPR